MYFSRCLYKILLKSAKKICVFLPEWDADPKRMRNTKRRGRYDFPEFRPFPKIFKKLKKVLP